MAANFLKRFRRKSQPNVLTKKEENITLDNVNFTKNLHNTRPDGVTSDSNYAALISNKLAENSLSRSNNASELRVFWRPPRVELRRTVNPIFVNEPVEFYEDLPNEYEGNTVWYSDSGSHDNQTERGSSFHRSFSTGQINSVGLDINPSVGSDEIGFQRLGSPSLNQSLPEYIHRVSDFPADSCSISSMTANTDSGVVVDDIFDRQLQKAKAKARTVSAESIKSVSDESGNESMNLEGQTASNEDIFTQTESTNSKGVWLKTRKFSLNEPLDENGSFINDIDAILNESDDSQPKRTYSAPPTTKKKTEVSFSSHGRQKLKSDDLFYNVEKILNDLQSHLNVELQKSNENLSQLDNELNVSRTEDKESVDNNIESNVAGTRRNIPPSSLVIENITNVAVPLAESPMENRELQVDVDTAVMKFGSDMSKDENNNPRSGSKLKSRGSFVAKSHENGTFSLSGMNCSSDEDVSAIRSVSVNSGARPKSNSATDLQSDLAKQSYETLPEHIKKYAREGQVPFSYHLLKKKSRRQPSIEGPSELDPIPDTETQSAVSSSSRSTETENWIALAQSGGPSIDRSNNDRFNDILNEHAPFLAANQSEHELEENFVDSYLSIPRSTNTITSSGVTILRRESSVCRPHPPKKKTIEDILLEGTDVYPDRACKRTIMALMVRCYNYGSDCDWTGELADLQDHLNQCELVPVSCVNACGRVDIPRNMMGQHIDVEGDCPLAVVNCRYGDMGCKFKARRVDMESHMKETVEQHLELAHMRIRELEVRQENICMNGKFLWKITNYEHLVKQSATKKEKEKLCSPPFYTGQYGYKLRAEAFLNGLGQGKGSHLSLYVVIMKGEYDAILPWPFKQNVDFVLIDQDEDVTNRQNKIWKLSCERNSDYFKRPNKSKSLGFGCPKFVSLETLRTKNYIKDQTLFIKIEVEPTDGLVFASQSKSSN